MFRRKPLSLPRNAPQFFFGNQNNITLPGGAVPDIPVQIIQLPGHIDLPLPGYQSEHAAAMDLCAAVRDSVVIEPTERALIPCGIAIAIPSGNEGQVRSRSGLAIDHGVIVLNAPGTIDSDYRGEIKVALINHGSCPFAIERGMRIAQLALHPVQHIIWERVDAIPPTPRGEGGFGHTGQ